MAALSIARGVFTTIGNGWRSLPPFAPGEKLSWRAATAIAAVWVGMALQAYWNIGYRPEWVADTLMPLLLGWAPQPTKAKPLAFIDIDERTYEAWGYPLLTPRGKLVRLIEFAVENKAKIVVVDVELPRSLGRNAGRWQAGDDFCMPAPQQGLTADDCDLIEFLEGYGPESPPLVFPRPLDYGPRAGTGRYCLRPIATALDGVIETKPNLYWGSALYERDEDAVVRRWRPWEAIETQAGAEPLASFQLLVCSYLRAATPTSTQEELHKWVELELRSLEGVAEERCERRAFLPVQAQHTTVCDKNLAVLGADEVEQRLLYTIGWQEGSDSAAGDSGFGWPWLNEPMIGGEEEPQVSLFRLLPAHTITEDGGIALEALNGRIVVIGASHYASADLQRTPVGVMPGAMVIVNAINTWQQVGPVRSWPWPIRAAAGAGIAVLAATCFHYFHFSVASLLAVGLIMVLGGLANWISVPHGYWLDLVGPSFFLALQTMAVDLGGMWAARRRLGWRWALFRPQAAPTPTVHVPRDTTDASGPPPLMVLAGVLGLTIALSSPAALAQHPADEVGLVTGIEGASAGAAIAQERAGKFKEVTPALYQPLRVGDQIRIKDSGTIVTVTLGNGRKIHVDRAASPYVLAKRGWSSNPGLALLMAPLRKVAELLTITTPAQTSLTAATTRNHGRRLAMPLFERREQAVVAGARRFTASWTGGAPPFEFILWKERIRPPLFRIAEVRGQDLPPREVALRPGRHHLMVKDADGEIVEAAFDVVGQDTLPKVGVGIGAKDLPTVLVALAGAADLWSREDGRWGLEALLRIAPFVDEEQGARVLHDALAEGRQGAL